MIGQDQFPEENIPYDHQSQYDIRQSMWDKLNNLHMLVSDHVHDKQIQHQMCQLLHKTHDDIDKLFTAIKEETLDAKPAKEQAQLEKAACPKCDGEGWLWDYELDHYSYESHGSTDTRYDCDACEGTGVKKALEAT